MLYAALFTSLNGWWWQWQRYTRGRQVKWPGWKIHRPGSALSSPAYCFASVIVCTKNKNVTISDRFICFILTVKRRWRPVFWGRQLKKVVNFFEEKVHPGDLTWGFSDLDMTWLLYCACTATGWWWWWWLLIVYERAGVLLLAGEDGWEFPVLSPRSRSRWVFCSQVLTDVWS